MLETINRNGFEATISGFDQRKPSNMIRLSLIQRCLLNLKPWWFFPAISRDDISRCSDLEDGSWLFQTLFIFNWLIIDHGNNPGLSTLGLFHLRLPFQSYASVLALISIIGGFPNFGLTWNRLREFPEWLPILPSTGLCYTASQQFGCLSHFQSRKVMHSCSYHQGEALRDRIFKLWMFPRFLPSFLGVFCIWGGVHKWSIPVMIGL